MSARVRNNYHPRLYFHDVHGENIELSRNKTVARRSTGFCSGLVFSDRPIRINERVYVKCLEVDQNWSGAFRIGFTMHDPQSMRSNLPRYLSPDLTSKHGNWGKAVGDKYAKKDSILYYYVDESGDVHYGIGTEECGIIFGGVNTSGTLWTVLDIYGNTVALEFIDPISLDLNFSSASIQAIERIRYKELLQPISFHGTHGANVKLTGQRSLASKKAGTHSLAYVFTNRPIKRGETIRMVVRQTDHYCEGLLVYGLTSCDPKNIKSHELPVNVTELLDRSEYWVFREKSHAFETGDTITFKINNQGQVQMNVNDLRKDTFDTFHAEDPAPLWLFVNLSHSISELRLSSNVKIEPFKNSSVTNTSEKESEKPGVSDQQSPSDSECVICCEGQIDCVIYRCGHMCMCYECASKLKKSLTSECPICRGSIQDIIKVYK